ncbi:MAG: hypothetical protein MUE40_02785, partial [Anaerolineae bacterium]|nr:hypothetical protein [Anaerolineae bacterium]
MRFLKGLGRFIWRFMVIFSFIVNLVLVVVLIGAGILIFEIKNNIADPLVGGLHSTAVGLENATIDWTIPVRDTIPVNLDVALNTETIVVLTRPVPLQVNALIDLPGINAFNVNATVELELPAGLQLPVQLNLNVPVREPALPVSLDVRAVIPLKETQLADPIRTLALLFEPLAIGLHNLPSDFNQAGAALGQILTGERPLEAFNLLATDGSGGINAAPYVPWAGYSRTAGLDYALFNQPVPATNRPLSTGLVPPGGIPFLDEQLPARAPLYADDSTPDQVTQTALAALAAQGIPAQTYDGSMANYYLLLQAALPPDATVPPVDT